MKQIYKKYNNDDQEVWKILFERQQENLGDKTDETYKICCEELDDSLNSKSIPRFENLNKELSKNGWSIEVVPGLIPVEDFFSLLAERKFCSSTWLRNKSQLDYLEEPDMFHDTFGHIPLIMNEVYSSFMEKFGSIGKSHLTDSTVLTALQRLYWFTIEFGLMKGINGPLIYGAGIISSFGETNHIYSDSIEVIPFDIEKVIDSPFINSEIQNLYYQIESFEDLYTSLDQLQVLIDRGLNIRPEIVR